MNEEKQNREYYQETFREVHAPQGMAERLMNMEEGKNKKNAGYVAKWIAIAAVAAVVLFAGSNGIAYATTGSTWVETMVYKLTLHGIEYDVDLNVKNQNGEIRYEGKFQEADGDESTLFIDSDGNVTIATAVAELRGSKGRIYLKDGDVEIDVTDDLSDDGYATGTYERNGFTKEYRIYESGDWYSYDVRTIYDGVPEYDWLERETIPAHQESVVVGTPTPTPEP